MGTRTEVIEYDHAGRVTKRTVTTTDPSTWSSPFVPTTTPPPYISPRWNESPLHHYLTVTC